MENTDASALGFKKLPSISEWIRDTVRILKGRFTRIFFPLFIIALWLLVFSFLIDAKPNGPWHLELILVLLMIGATPVAYCWAFSATFCALVEKEKGDLKTLAIKALKKAWPLFLLSVLAAMVLSVAFLALIVPWVVVGIWFSFSPFVLVDENLRGTKALLKSRELVRGYWWPVFGRMLLLVVFSYLLNILFVIAGVFLSPVLTDSIVSVLGIMFMPLPLAALFSIYKALKERNGSKIDLEKKGGKWITVWLVLGLVVGIGIFLAVVLASLNSARLKAEEARDSFLLNSAGANPTMNQGL